MAFDAARAKSLFLNASELADPAERTAYLERECGGDGALRQRVEALLAAHDGGERSVEGNATGMDDPTAPETVEATAAALAETRLPPAPTTATDRSVGADSTVAGAPRADSAGGFVAGLVIAGRYKLLEALGEGGMGKVYLAEQTAPVRRMVALKLIKIGMDSRAVLARFDAERQALALMDHPNIARVYDGGSTEGGQPFFVMELVSGEPITDYCDRKRLSVQARLELFVSVCQAVQHAHQKGIIHRDLKPSNVLVTEVDDRPTPKVIDFGVAKATELKLTDQSLGDTGAIVGTPAYMSPEQADPSSMDIDTRTDVYALGVILYELLVGSPPIDAKQFKRGAILEMLRMVREVDPPKPSTKVSTADALPSIAASRDAQPAHLKRALQGDLDWIVMMALEKDRSRRYETANGLASDILRHLAHEPVSAAPPSRAYRLRKFVRKHRGAVIAASLVLLSLMGGLAAVAAVQTVANARLAASLTRETKANNDLNSANAELTKSRTAVQARYDLAVDAIKTFHTGVSEDFLLKQEQFKELRNRLLRSASEFYGKLGALLGKETDLASRRALLQANAELAELTAAIGRRDDALATHRQVLAAREAVAAAPGADALARVDVGRSLTTVATLLFSTGKTDEAVATYRKAEAMLADLVRSFPSNNAARGALVKCRTPLGNFLASTGKTDDALALLRSARADQETLADDPGASSEARTALTETIFTIGNVLSQTGKPAEAEAEYRKAIEIDKKLVDLNPADAQLRNNLAADQDFLGAQLVQAGKLAEAEVEYRKALAIFQKLADDNPAVTEIRNNLARTHTSLGNLFRETGKPAEGEVEYRKGLAIYQRLADDNPAVTEFRRDLAGSHNSLGNLLSNTGKPSEAEAEYRQALALGQKLADDNPAVIYFRGGLAVSHGDFGSLLCYTGRPSEAEAEYRTALALWQRLADDNLTVPGYRSALATTNMNLGNLLRETGKPSEAEAEYRKGMTILHTLIDEGPKLSHRREVLATTLINLGGLVRKLGRPVEGLEYNDRAVALLEQLLNESPTRTRYQVSRIWSLTERGLCRRALGDPAGAAADVRRALSLSESLPPQAEGIVNFHMAFSRAALAGLAGQAGAGVSAAEGKVAADQAKALLRKAVDAGFRNLGAFRIEDALGPLREREDFKKLLAELEKPSPAKPEK
jgi:eukaryotic-like serine/threonine-protein kinase